VRLEKVAIRLCFGRALRAGCNEGLNEPFVPLSCMALRRSTPSAPLFAFDETRNDLRAYLTQE